MSTATVIFVAGFALICLGGLLQIPLFGLLTPEAERKRPVTAFWFKRNFTPEGQRVLRRGRIIQLTGVALMVLALVLSAV